jgi:hypothetical protein
MWRTEGEGLSRAISMRKEVRIINTKGTKGDSLLYPEKIT